MCNAAFLSLLVLSNIVARYDCSSLETRRSAAWENPAMSQPACCRDDLAAGGYDRIAGVIATNVRKFAIDMGEKLADNAPAEQNIVFSPISVLSTLALTMLGARGGSYKELKQVLGIDSDVALAREPSYYHTKLGRLIEELRKHDKNLSWHEDPWRKTHAHYNIRQGAKNASFEHKIEVSNGIFTQVGYELNPHYRDVIENIYQSEIIPLDFAKKPVKARDDINAWVDRVTFGRITNILQDNIPSDTRIIIANTLYFKAFWQNTFIKETTAMQDFFPNGTDCDPVPVKMMNTIGVFPFHKSEKYNCQIIGFPYKDNLTTMYVVQPMSSSHQGLKDFQHFLDADKIEELIGNMTKKAAFVSFPKMHIQNSIHLEEVLKELGVKDIFNAAASDLSLIAAKAPGSTTNSHASRESSTQASDGRKLSFAHLDGNRHTGDNVKEDLYISDILHNVDVVINEVGTEAAASTLALLTRSGPGLKVRIDTPFLMMIRHDPTKLILFYGIINKPDLKE